MLYPLALLATRFRSQIAEARTAHAEAVRLRSELASYRTGAERAELHAILSRHTEQELDLLAEKAGDRAWAA